MQSMSITLLTLVYLLVLLSCGSLLFEQVMSNIIEPALQTCGGVDQQLISQETFLVEFRKGAESVAQKLEDQPVIVAHSENTFEGRGIRRLLSNKF